MATRDLTRDGTAETKRSGVYTPRNEVDEVSDSRKQHLISQLRCLLPLKGKPLFCKSALIHRHTEVIRALVSKQSLPKKNCFSEGSNSFHSDKSEFENHDFISGYCPS